MRYVELAHESSTVPQDEVMMRRQEASREKQYVRSPSIVTGQPLSFRPSRHPPMSPYVRVGMFCWL